MPELSRPTVAVHDSFLAAMAEFIGEGRGPRDGSMIGYDIATYGPTWGSTEGFEAYVRHLHDEVYEETPRPANHVPSTTLWWVDGAESRELATAGLAGARSSRFAEFRELATAGLAGARSSRFAVYLGRISVRHRLTPALWEIGGHIGYDVRPSARRRGHATAMLRLALPVAHRLGIDPALITCDSANVASRRVIERNGGVFEDERRGTLRYWVRTTAG
jgi:predicted acetyltransferase